MDPSDERVICMIGGHPGDGKTYFLACLENAVLFDADLGGGAKYAEPLLEQHGSRRVPVSSYAEVLEELRVMVAKGKVPKNICFDAITVLHQYAIIEKNPTAKPDFNNAKDYASQQWMKVRKQINLMDCNLWATSLVKTKFENNEATGVIADAAKNIEGDFHIVIHLSERGEGEPWPPAAGGKYSVAKVAKWRRLPTDPRGPVPASFPFTLEAFQKIAGVGMVREVRQTVLPTPEQVAEVNQLVKVLRLDIDGALDKWFRNVGVERFEDAPRDSVVKLIEHLRSQLPTKEAAAHA